MGGYEPYHRPWMVFIQIQALDSDFRCGGSIINRYWILSAGHCFCEHLDCNQEKGGRLQINYKPQNHIRLVVGLKDVNIYTIKQHKKMIPEKIVIHPL